MATIFFYIKFVLAVIVFVKLIKLTIVYKYEKNLLLLFAVSFILLVDLNRMIENSLPKNTVCQLSVFFLLLYLLLDISIDKKSTKGLLSMTKAKDLFDSDVINNLKEGVALVRLDTYKVELMNSAYREILGDQKSFVTAKDIAQSILDMNEDKVIEVIDFNNEKRIIRCRANSIGKKYGLINIFDVTESELALEKNKTGNMELLKNWENAPNLVMLRHLDGRISFVNEAFASFFHKNRHNLLGRQFQNVYNTTIEADHHMEIHKQLISSEVEIQKGILKFTYPLGSCGYFSYEELLFSFEGNRQILTTAVDVTENYHVELMKNAYACIHNSDTAHQHSHYIVADLIHYDFLFKEQIVGYIKSNLSSISVFVNGLDYEDRLYFMDMLEQNRTFYPKTITFKEHYQFYVEKPILATTGHWIGILIKFLNPDKSLVNSNVIGSTIMPHIKEGILIIDREGKIQFANDMICRILGYSIDEMLALNISSISSGLTRDMIVRNLEMIDEHQSLHFERIYEAKDKMKISCEVIAMNLGSVHAGLYVLLVTDTSDRFAYKQRKMESKSRYAQIFDSIQESILEIQLPDKLVSVFKEFDLEKGLIGYEKSFLQWLNEIHDQDRSIVYEAIDVITAEKRTNYAFEYRFFKDGKWQWYSAFGKYVASDEGASIFIINQNISEIKQISNRLDEHMMILNESERIANMAHWKYYVAKNVFSVSKTFGPLFLNSNEMTEIYYQNFVENIFPVDFTYFEEKFNRFIWQNESLDLIFRMHNKGKVKFVNLIGQVYRDDENVPIYAIGSIADVTERMLSRKRIEESRTLLEHVVEQVPLGIVVITSDHRIEKINQVALQHLEILENSILNVEDLKQHLMSKIDDFDVEKFDELTIGKLTKKLQKSLSMVVRLNQYSLKFTANMMQDADKHSLGRILNIEVDYESVPVDSKENLLLML